MSDSNTPATAGAALDKRSAKAFQRLSNSKAVRAAREQGVLGPDEEIVGGVLLTKYSPSINILMNPLLGVLPGLVIVLLVQRSALLLVTPRRVVLTPWYVASPKKKFEQALQSDRPIEIARLNVPPTPGRRGATKALLAPRAQGLLGRESAHVLFGVNADNAFRLANTASA